MGIKFQIHIKGALSRSFMRLLCLLDDDVDGALEGRLIFGLLNACPF